MTDQSANGEVDVGVISRSNLDLGRSASMRILRLAVLALGLAVGASSLVLARRGSGYSFAGGSAYAAAAELIAGYALLVVGLVAWARPRQRRLGAILAAAAIAWFLLEWNNPSVDSSFVFSIGLVLYVAAAPLVAMQSSRIRMAA